jgi:predicted phage tail protein
MERRKETQNLIQLVKATQESIDEKLNLFPDIKRQMKEIKKTIRIIKNGMENSNINHLKDNNVSKDDASKPDNEQKTENRYGTLKTIRRGVSIIEHNHDKNKPEN